MTDTKDLAKFCWNLINYIRKHLDMLSVSEDLYKERVSTCKSCEQYDEIENQCKLCGCYVPAKARNVFDSCPVKKWDVDVDSWEEKFQKIVEELDKESESK